VTLIRRLLGASPDAIRHDLRDGRSTDLALRRAIIGTSLAGMASMTAVSLLQTGIVRHLPDPPVRSFDSDGVNMSDAAFQFGIPDGTISLASFASNLPLAAAGPAGRARSAPWIPLAVTAKAAVEAVVAGWYFYQMPAKEKAWCGYCIAAAAASLTVLALSVPEARQAWIALRRS
jgi:uncharacterized membrane protein